MDSERIVPTTVGIIVDGNRRWAKRRGLLPWEGHEAGYKKLKQSAEWLRDLGVKHTIAYVFSTENWKRKEEEVGALMKLLERVLSNELDWILDGGFVLRCVGDKTALSPKLRTLLDGAENRSSKNTSMTLGLAWNYGGRADIVQAVNKIITEQRKRDEIVVVTEENISQHLYTAGIPDPDMIIRTGGEKRLSNFLPWQTIYSELFFVDKYFPGIERADIEDAIDEFNERHRRFGK